MSGKPRVLVLGGLGFIGRHLVKYIVENDLASKVRVVDKTMVAMARLGKEFTGVFDKVETIQANLISAEGSAKAFHDTEGDYAIVFNLAAETKLAQEDKVYEAGIVQLSTAVAQQALKHKTEKFIEVSTAEVYEASNKPSNETSPLKPWTGIGKASLKAEEALKAMPSLPLIIARPAIVYGPGDIKGLAPRLCIAAVYKKKGEKLEYPQWFEENKINTFHVNDVARALWHLSANGKVGDVYNLVDKHDTDQKKLNIVIEKLFGIQTGHLGLLKSEAAKLLTTETLLDEINGEIIPTWVKMTGEAKLSYTPLSPYLMVKPFLTKDFALMELQLRRLHSHITIPLLEKLKFEDNLITLLAKDGFLQIF